LITNRLDDPQGVAECYDGGHAFWLRPWLEDPQITDAFLVNLWGYGLGCAYQMALAGSHTRTRRWRPTSCGIPEKTREFHSPWDSLIGFAYQGLETRGERELQTIELAASWGFEEPFEPLYERYGSRV
jgi:hypothetical protein